ncbi:phosphate ABC transporter permease PstA [Mobilicoccus caccae]|uniref:Phosphate transport system permease protein PstA n=1 Tax=Mobilicoccus caccae TaxID=1859295 RepID=A0ABQ6ITK5_9MICO|nr:phosphate ABC transporter permease PstA [Mobilicoccus caccae]GMA41006.1 phosphate transport system permease protein PstA [Mobilicoccus caccae]
MTRTDDHMKARQMPESTSGSTAQSGATKTGASGASGGTLAHGTLSPTIRRAIGLGAIAAGFALSFLLGWGFNQVGIVVLAALIYCVTIYAASRATEGSRHALDRLVTGVVTTMFALALIPLVSVLIEVVRKGAERFDVEFFTLTMRGIVGEGGGAYHAIQGTLIVTAIASVVAIPIGILAAIYLVEYGQKNRLARALTFFVDVMTGIPSIVAGLFAYALWVLFMGPGARAGIIGATALAVLMIPTVVRSTEEMLRIVPNDLREAAYALGVPKWLTIVKVVLPTALAGIATGVTLAIARVIGETAPLLVTVGITTSYNANPFSGRMATLPVFSYYQYATPGIPPEPFLDRAWAAALVLMLIVMGLNIIARVISKLFAPKAGR